MNFGCTVVVKHWRALLWEEWDSRFSGTRKEVEAAVCVSVSVYKAYIANMIKQKPSGSL